MLLDWTLDLAGQENCFLIIYYLLSLVWPVELVLVIVMVLHGNIDHLPGGEGRGEGWEGALLDCQGLCWVLDMDLLALRHVLGQCGGMIVLLSSDRGRRRTGARPRQLLELPDAKGQPLLVTQTIEAGVLQVLNADGGHLLDTGVALGHQTRSVLLQPQQPQPLLQTALQVSRG